MKKVLIFSALYCLISGAFAQSQNNSSSSEKLPIEKKYVSVEAELLPVNPNVTAKELINYSTNKKIEVISTEPPNSAPQKEPEPQKPSQIKNQKKGQR